VRWLARKELLAPSGRLESARWLAIRCALGVQPPHLIAHLPVQKPSAWPRSMRLQLAAR
jgi:hypothetical protein